MILPTNRQNNLIVSIRGTAGQQHPTQTYLASQFNMHFLKGFEHKCMLEVCLHIHPIMIKIHPVCFFLLLFFLSLFKKKTFSNQAVLRFLSEWCSSTIVDWQDRLTLDPPWVSWELSASGAGEDKMSQIKQLRCFVVGCRNDKITFFWQCAIPDLPKCVSCESFVIQLHLQKRV